jgi:glycosyltransferase involved in cell wall biosynthesis
MPLSNPLISVLLPVRNAMPFLPETMASLRAQTFRDVEIIVLDDGSTDETPSYLASLDEPRLRIVCLNKVGLATALNFGLEIARAPIVARLDGDDVAHFDRFELQYDYLQKHPECILLGCQCRHIDEHGQEVEIGAYPTSDTAIRWEALFRSPVLHPGSMFRRDVVRQVGGYDPEFAVAQDYDLWTRLLPRGIVANLPQFLLRYRVHAQSVGTLQKDRQIANGSRIAGAYAAALGQGIEARTISGLYLFLATGQPPPDCTVNEIVRAFHDARQLFLEQARGDVAELKAGIRNQQDSLRWRMTSSAEENWSRPWKAFSWLRYAVRVDPDKAGYLALLRRRWDRLFVRRRSSLSVR